MEISTVWSFRFGTSEVDHVCVNKFSNIFPSQNVIFNLKPTLFFNLDPCISQPNVCRSMYVYYMTNLLTSVPFSVRTRWRTKPCIWAHTRRGRTEPCMKRRTKDTTCPSFTFVMKVRTPDRMCPNAHKHRQEALFWGRVVAIIMQLSYTVVQMFFCSVVAKCEFKIACNSFVCQ